jgi:ankyrin repeat protein
MIKTNTEMFNDMFNDMYSDVDKLIDLRKASNDKLKNFDPYSLSHYSVSIIRKALRYGYDINKQDSRGYTLLHWCTKHQPSTVRNVLKFILENGADLSIVSHKGYSVMDIAIEYNQMFAKYLVKYYDVPETDEYKRMLLAY